MTVYLRFEYNGRPKTRVGNGCIHNAWLLSEISVLPRPFRLVCLYTPNTIQDKIDAVSAYT